MYAFTRSRRRWFLAGLLATPLLMTSLLARGQADAYYQATTVDSARGYWRLQTDYTHRMTRVSFYSVQHELLYQEKIIDRYVKLTRRTVRQFDELLAKLVDRHLVADQVKSYDLLASNRWFSPPQPAQGVTDEPGKAFPIASPDQLSVHVLLIQGKKLKLTYQNVAQQRLLITMSDDSFRRLYAEKSSLSADAKLFDVSRLAGGTYRFEVDGGQKTILYKLVIPEAGGRAELNQVVSRTKP